MIKFLLVFITIILEINCESVNHNSINSKLEGLYCKTTNSNKIYLKIKSINDSLYYFLLKDYDTSNLNYKQRSVVGTFIFSKNKGNLFNANCYPFHHFSLVQRSTQTLTIDTSYFRMYYTFTDIRGTYSKISDSINVGFQEFNFIQIPSNIAYAKKQTETDFYNFPSKYSKAKRIQLDKNEKIFIIITVGGFIGINPSPSEMIRFSLIEIPKTSERGWINTDIFEDDFKAHL